MVSSSSGSCSPRRILTQWHISLFHYSKSLIPLFYYFKIMYEAFVLPIHFYNLYSLSKCCSSLLWLGMCVILEVPLHTLKAYTGSGVIAPLVLNLSTRRMLVINCTPQPLYAGRRTPVPIWTGGRVGPTAGLHVWEKRKISCPCQESNCTLPSPQPSHHTDCTIPVPRYWKTLELWKWKTLYFT
jgi:hypothetical protein